MAIQNKSNRNKFKIDDVSQFSSNDEVALAAVGRYGKYNGDTYTLTIIKDVVFINTWGGTEKKIKTIPGKEIVITLPLESKIDLPAHYDFKFTDDAGTHTVTADETSITVKGITSFNFIYKQ